MAVLRPLRVVIDNYPDGLSGADGRRQQSGRPRRRHPQVPSPRVLYIEQEDFREDRQAVLPAGPRARVRLRSAYFVRCESVVKNEHGEVVELHCT